MEECHACGNEASHKCEKCYSALYCGSECQKEHWNNEHSEWCFDKHDSQQIQSVIEDHLDLIPIEDDIDKDFAEIGEALLDEDISRDPELMGMAIDWIAIGAWFKTDKARAARGQKLQAKGLRKERRAQGRLNPKRLILRSKENKLRGKAAMNKKSGKKVQKKKRTILKKK